MTKPSKRLDISSNTQYCVSGRDVILVFEPQRCKKNSRGVQLDVRKIFTELTTNAEARSVYGS